MEDNNNAGGLDGEDELDQSGPGEEAEQIGTDTDEEVEPDVQEAQDDLSKARSEASEYLENLQRLKAEFENFRKRMLKEQSDFLKFASHGLILELLPVLDNFDRALDHGAGPDQFEKYEEGLKLVYSQILDILAREGLSVLDPVGHEFDPTKHEAVMQQDSDDHDEGIVISVVEKGYVLKDRVIRPPKVVVAK